MQVNTIQFAKALADETRQEIMQRLCCQWLNVTDLVVQMGDLSQPTVSHHLRVLRESSLVHTRREGKQVFYSLNQEAFTICCGHLMQTFAPDKTVLISRSHIPVID